MVFIRCRKSLYYICETKDNALSNISSDAEMQEDVDKKQQLNVGVPASRRVRIFISSK